MIKKGKEEKNMKQRIIIVGDVHGCLEELKELLEKIKYEIDKDRLIFVGDLVGKGPKSVEVVDYVMKIGAEAVMGNWEYNLIHRPCMLNHECSTNITTNNNEEQSVFNELQLKWLRKLPYYLHLPEHNVVIVHAGLVPNIPLKEQKSHSMISMRNILSSGETHHSPDAGGKAWVEVWKGPYYVVFGHDAKRGLQLASHALGIDTGCVYGNELTAYLLPTKELVSVKAYRRYCKKDKDKDKDKNTNKNIHKNKRRNKKEDKNWCPELPKLNPHASRLVRLLFLSFFALLLRQQVQNIN